MAAKDRDRHSIVTTGGSDGACAAAAVLLRHTDCPVYVTSQNAVHLALGANLYLDPRPTTVHVCGVGIADNLDEVLERLEAMQDSGMRVFWYCGRGYLDARKKALGKHCRPVFEKAESNTAVIIRRMQLARHERCGLLARLARQWCRKEKPPREDQFWHDLVQAASDHFFQFGDEERFLRGLRKLAGLLPLNQADRDEVQHFQRSGRGKKVSLGISPQMDRVRELVARIAPLEEPVLILGPSGSGKELVARALHDGSPRRGERFYPVNCAILCTNPDLAYDRLFGHAAGAYTSAKGAAPGAFEAANGGTLFLDEVAELPLSVQAQLLRALEEKKISPLGTVDAHPVDVRLVAATNRSLARMVSQGNFRLDLYHRLNVLTLEVPALKDRIQDAKSLAGALLADLQKEGFHHRLTPKDWKAVGSYDWPGNVRQFLNLLKRAVLMGVPFHQVIGQERRQDASNPEARPRPDLFLPESPDQVSLESEIRRAYMSHVLKLFSGNRKKAAKALGVSENTLRKWVPV